MIIHRGEDAGKGLLMFTVGAKTGVATVEIHTDNPEKDTSLITSPEKKNYKNYNRTVSCFF